MNNKQIIIGVSIIVMLLAGGYALFNLSARSNADTNEAMMMEDEVMMPDSSTQPTTDQPTMENDALMEDKKSMMEKNELMDNDNQMEMENDSMEDDDQTMTQPDRYLAYSPQVWADTADTKRVLFFYANWCPTCKPANEDFQTNQSQIPDDVTVIRVNYDDNQTDAAEKALAQNYDITYQHTFVQLDENNQVVTRWNGGQLKELLANLK